MMSSTNRCRLCVKMCQESKNLYDENGCGNAMYDITMTYFHPKFININLAKHLTGICLECWQHISDFQSFQTTVMFAQKFLEISDELVKTTDHDGSEGFNTTQLVIKEETVESEEEKSVQSYVSSIKAMDVLQACENSTANDSGLIALPKMEIMNVECDNSNDDDSMSSQSEFISDSEEPPAAKMDNLEIADSTQDLNALIFVEELNRKYSAVNLEKLIAKHMQTNVQCDNSDENSTANDSRQIALPKVEIIDVDCDNSNDDSMSTQSKFISDSEESLLSDDDDDAANKTDNLEIASSNQDLNIVKFIKELRQKCREVKVDELIAKHMPTLSCDHCSKKFKTFSSFYKHIALQHPNVDTYFTCFCSDKKWNILEDKHRIKHNIKYHFLIHEDPDFFKCLICSSTYKYKNNLQRHIMSQHTDSPKNVCKICGQCYTTKKGLAKHKNSVHKNNRDNSLRVIRTETGTKYACNECGKILISPISMKRHIDSMHSKKAGKIYKCEVCENTFKQPRTLREHATKHTKKDLYACAFCAEKFKRMSKVIIHRREVHPLEQNKNFYHHIK